MEKEDEDNEELRRGRCEEVVWPTHVGTMGMLGGMEAVEGGVWWGDS